MGDLHSASTVLADLTGYRTTSQRKLWPCLMPGCPRLRSVLEQDRDADLALLSKPLSTDGARAANVWKLSEASMRGRVDGCVSCRRLKGGWKTQGLDSYLLPTGYRLLSMTRPDTASMSILLYTAEITSVEALFIIAIPALQRPAGSESPNIPSEWSRCCGTS